MRLFFAAFPDVETRERIEDAARALGLRPPARPVPPAKYHMTVVFLGEVAELRLAAVREIGSRRCGRCFSLRFDHLEFWSKARALVMAASHCPAALEQLRISLEADLSACGVAFDAQPLRPHVTLARKIVQAPVVQAPGVDILWSVRAIHLVSSATRAAAAGSTVDASIYTVVDTWPLLDNRDESL